MENKKSTWITGILLVGIVFFLLHHIVSISITGVIHHISSCILYPVLHLQRVLVEPIKHWSEKRAREHELRTLIDGLQVERDTLLAENITLRSALAYHKDIQEVLRFSQRYKDEGRIAQVLLKHLSSQDHYFLVEGGLAQGISKDMVAVYKNNLIGRVTEVFPWYSKVQLITDPSCKVAAYCTKTRIHGIHKGVRSERESMLDYVSHLEPLQIDDLVVSSGEGLVFPQGFALGKIAAYEVDGLYQQVKVTPNINFRSIRYCVLLARR